jgi:hypothetical protein
VNDPDGDDMNIAFHSNATESWTSFGNVHLGAGNTFGYDDNIDNGDSCVNTIRGTWFTCPADGTAYSINVNGVFTGTLPYGKNVKAGLYYKSDGTFVASTQEHNYHTLASCPDGESYCPWWDEFVFSSPVQLYGGEEYYVVVWGESDAVSYSNLSKVNRSIYINWTYGTWPDTLNNINYTNGVIYDIYVKYNTTSTGDGTYYCDNLDMGDLGKKYYWNVSASDGDTMTNSPKFNFYLRNQSKIYNWGNTSIKGYLLLQVQYYANEEWTPCTDVVYDTTPRTILAGQQLALDGIFNDLIYAYDLLYDFGCGNYRVYASFNDPYGNVLVCNNETTLEASYEFSISPPPISTLYTEDFENDLGREWSFYYNNPDYAQNQLSSIDSHSGSNSWRMDVFTGYGFYYNLNELILHVKIRCASFLDLSFYTKEYTDEQNLMPSSFIGHNKSDGIAVSTDRTNWVKLWQYPSSVSNWNEFGPMDIGNNISLSGDVYIKFQQYDNGEIQSDGILWDDIHLTSDGFIITRPEFVLPAWGGAMIHSDQHLTDFINMSVPRALGDEWTTYNSTTYGRNERMEIDDDDNCWRMDVKDSGYYNLNEIIIHIEMNGASYLNLDFSTKEYSDEQDSMPSSFTGHSNADGIAVSTDNTNWVRLWQYPNLVPFWAEYGPIDIGDFISLSSDVYIKFQQYGEYPILGIPSDGIIWDDISLETDGTMTYGSGHNTSSYLEDFDMTAWIRNEEQSEQSQNFGNGIAGNGEIAACPFAYAFRENNLIVYDYNGNRVWKSDQLLGASTTSSTSMVSIDNKVIACDSYKVIMVDPYFNEDGECIWSTQIPGGPVGFILSPTITENGVILLPAMNGNIYAFNSDNGDYLGSYNFDQSGYSVMSTNGISTQNSACVNDNRVYVLAEKSDADSRLYAIDVSPDGVFTTRWHADYPGKSQASPTFIDDTLYFDYYQNLIHPEDNVGVHAVEDTGLASYHWKWNTSLTHMTWFTMTADPRGDSIWFEDTAHRILERLALSDGTLMETIYLESLMGSGYRPISVMQICGETNPMMIVSANYPLFACYVICIDLEYQQNSLMWKNRVNSTWDCDYAGGQYTILLDEMGYNPRIVFGAYWGGVYALGH